MLGLCYADDPSRNLETEDLFRRAVALDPHNPLYVRDLANAQIANQKLAEAEQNYRLALQYEPDNAQSQFQLGRFLIDHQPTPARMQEAEMLLRKSLARNPNNGDIPYNLGRLLLKRGEAKEAIPFLETAVSLSPQLAPAWYDLATAYDHIGNAKRADYCRAMFHTVSEYAKTLSFTLELAQAHHKDAAVRLKLARLYAEDGDFAKAINQYQVYQMLNPKNTAVHQELLALEKHLKATGQMPSMTAFNGMVIAAVKPH